MHGTSITRDNINNSKFNPYFTTFGKTIKSNVIVEALIKMGTSRVFRDSPYSYSLSYDLVMGDFIPVVITGKSEEEKSIPPFQLPILYINHKDEACVAIDLREYVSNVNESVKTYDELISCMSRPNNGYFLFRLANVMCSLAGGEYSKIPFRDGLKAFVFVFTSVIKNILSLDVEEEDRVRVCLGTYYYNLASKDNMHPTDLDRVTDIIKNNCYILKLDNGDIKQTVLALITENTAVSDEKLNSLSSLLDYISCFLVSDKQQKMKDAIIVNVLTNIWFGPGKNFAGISSIECLPLFLTMVESCYDDKSFKMSRLAGILSKDTRSVDKRNFVQTMSSNFKYN